MIARKRPVHRSGLLKLTTTCVQHRTEQLAHMGTGKGLSTNRKEGRQGLEGHILLSSGLGRLMPVYSGNFHLRPEQQFHTSVECRLELWRLRRVGCGLNTQVRRVHAPTLAY